MTNPGYRRLGLPATSSPMESLGKQMNLRVKGTEMFWMTPPAQRRFSDFALPRSLPQHPSRLPLRPPNHPRNRNIS